MNIEDKEKMIYENLENSKEQLIRNIDLLNDYILFNFYINSQSLQISGND